MNDNLIPIAMFRKWLRKTPEGRRKDRELPWGAQTPYADELPFMVAEGTGMYDTLGKAEPLAPLMAYVYRMPSLNGFKKPITHNQDEVGQFFVGSLLGLTNYWIRRGSSYGTFNYTTLINGTEHRGATYEDMVRGGVNVGIRMHERVPDDVMRVIDEAVKLRPSPHALVLTERQGHESHPLLDKLAAQIKSWERPAGDARFRVPVYVRPLQLSEQVIGKMASDLRQLGAVWKLDYKLERLTDECWGYRARVYVNPKLMKK